MRHLCGARSALLGRVRARLDHGKAARAKGGGHRCSGAAEPPGGGERKRGRPKNLGERIVWDGYPVIGLLSARPRGDRLTWLVDKWFGFARPVPRARGWWVVVSLAAVDDWMPLHAAGWVG